VDARDRILLAFRELVLSVPFEEFKTHDVIRQAAVARSTFYAHFRDKNDLLLASLGPILSVLAGACRGSAEPGVLTETLEHVWENRVVGRVLFRPPVSGRLARELVDLLKATRVDGPRCHFMAHGLLGVLGAWVNGDVRMTPAELSERLLPLSAEVSGAMSKSGSAINS
jgi:AcrR family transcriptional regulator